MAQAAPFHADNQTRIRRGLLIALVGTGFCLPWAAVLAVHLQRIEGRWSPLAYTRLVGGVLLTLLAAFLMFAMAAAFRPAERSPEIA